MPWITPIDLRVPDREGGKWTVLQPLGFRSQKFVYPDCKYKVYLVPAGFETDLASVPRLPFVYWLFGGRGKRAAVVHDYLYAEGMRLKLIEDRAEADSLFLEIMMYDGVGGFIAEAMHWGVMTFGEKYFCEAIP